MFCQRADIFDLASAGWPHPTPARLVLIVGFAAGVALHDGHGDLNSSEAAPQTLEAPPR
jgi:hypothetical protein